MLGCKKELTVVLNFNLPTRFSLIAFAISTSINVAQCDERVQSLLAANENRQQRYTRVVADMHITEWIAKNSRQSMPDPKAAKKAGLYPADNLQFNYNSRLYLQDDCVLYEDRMPIPESKIGVWHEKLRVYAFNGKNTTILDPEGLAGLSYPSSGRVPGQQLETLKRWALLPLMMYLRGHNKDLCPVDVGDLRPTGNIAQIGDVACDEFVLELGSGKRRVFWFSQDSARTLRKASLSHNDRISERIDVFYSKDESNISTLERWDCSRYDAKGSTINQVSIQLKLDRPAGIFDSKIFEPNFIKGGDVVDRLSGEEYKLTEDGTKLVYDKTNKSFVNATSHHNRYKYAATVVLLIVFVLALAAYVRSKRLGTQK